MGLFFWSFHIDMFSLKTFLKYFYLSPRINSCESNCLHTLYWVPINFFLQFSKSYHLSIWFHCIFRFTEKMLRLQVKRWIGKLQRSIHHKCHSSWTRKGRWNRPLRFWVVRKNFRNWKCTQRRHVLMRYHFKSYISWSVIKLFGIF